MLQQLLLEETFGLGGSQFGPKPQSFCRRKVVALQGIEVVVQRIDQQSRLVHGPAQVPLQTFDWGDPGLGL